MEEHRSKTSFLEGQTNASIIWRFSFSSGVSLHTFGLKFNDTTIGGLRKSGKPGVYVTKGFKGKYAVKWFPPENITLVIFKATTEVNYGIFGCTVSAQSKDDTIAFTSKSQVEVVGKLACRSYTYI